VWLDQVSGSMRLYSVKMMKSTVSDYDFHAAVKLDKWRIPQHDDGQGRLPVCWRKARKGEGRVLRKSPFPACWSFAHFEAAMWPKSRSNRFAHFPLIAQAIAMSIKNEVQYIAKVSELLSETERDQFVQVLKTRRGGAGWNAESPLMISPSKHPPASSFQLGFRV
jgi:hypothetical protein